jgi:CDP-4-dehydro-6-deoxyglucose reductase, E3
MLNRIRPTRAGDTFIPAEYDALVLAADPVSPHVRLITLQVLAADPLRFDAGVYMEFMLGRIQPARPYSIVNVPEHDGSAPQGLLYFLVARHPRGAASRYLHDSLSVGDKVRLRGPFGTFRFPTQTFGRVVMLAGGTGLAPLLAIASQALRRGQCRSVELLFSVRTRSEVFFADELYRLSQQYPSFRYKLCLSRFTGEETLPPTWATARIPDYLAAQSLLLQADLVLIPGSPSFVSACAERASLAGIEPDAVLTEAYETRSSPARTHS